MTNELAIRILTGDVLGTSEQTHEAIKMAVKVLSLPSAQPETKRGRWYVIGNTGLATCECGFITDRYCVCNFCPACGLDMREETEDDND